MKLLKFAADYADELNLHGFTIMSDGCYNLFVQRVRELGESDWPCQWNFGGNFDMTFESPTDYLSTLRVTTITAEVAEELEALFPRCKSFRASNGAWQHVIRPRHYGFFPWIFS